MNERKSSAVRTRQAWLDDPNSPIGGHTDAHGGYFYVKNELLVIAEDLPRLERALPQDIKLEHDDAGKLGVLRLRLQDPQSRVIPDVLASIRAADTKLRSENPELLKEPPIRVGPNHVLSGEPPEYDGGPAGPARAADHGWPARESTMRTRLMLGQGLGKGIKVTVIDTSYTPGPHPELDAQVTAMGKPPELDAEPKDGQIDYEAGHGTFVAGLILRRAPRAHVTVVGVLGPAGYGTEHDIAQAILEHEDSDVINLSLGGYTDGDRAPWSIDKALQQLRPETAVVAAAGNHGSSRPMWPAAFKRVIAVGAVNNDKQPQRADFSNFGGWVDACAPAVEILGPFPRYPPAASSASASDPSPLEPYFDGWAIWSGTSFAAPKVSGEIAARASLFRYASPRAVGASLVNGRKRRHLPGLGALLEL